MFGSVSQRPPTVLCVEDDATARVALACLLRSAGFEVWEAASGEEALCLAAAGPDLVVLDVGLPDADGFELCGSLKAEPATAWTPVILVSGYAIRTEDVVHGLEGGADA